MRLFRPFHADREGDTGGLNAAERTGHPGIQGGAVVDLVIACCGTTMAKVVRDECDDGGVVPSAGKVGLQVNRRSHNLHHNGGATTVSQAVASISMVALAYPAKTPLVILFCQISASSM
jgi:hypothetical protein